MVLYHSRHRIRRRTWHDFIHGQTLTDPNSSLCARHAPMGLKGLYQVQMFLDFNGFLDFIIISTYYITISIG